MCNSYYKVYKLFHKQIITEMTDLVQYSVYDLETLQVAYWQLGLEINQIIDCLRSDCPHNYMELIAIEFNSQFNKLNKRLAHLWKPIAGAVFEDPNFISFNIEKGVVVPYDDQGNEKHVDVADDNGGSGGRPAVPLASRFYTEVVQLLDNYRMQVISYDFGGRKLMFPDYPEYVFTQVNELNRELKQIIADIRCEIENK